MSFNTVMVKTLVEHGFDFGLESYPIFDEGYRPRLNGKIVEHYMLREIAHETPEIFAYRLNVKMNEIMPYYNKLYAATMRDIDIFSTVDTTTTGSSKQSSSGSQSADTRNVSRGTSQNASEAKASQSSYPNDYEADPEGLYGTNVNASSTHGSTSSEENSEGGSTSASSNKSDGESLSRTTGRTVPYADILSRLGDVFYNVDLMVIGELENLFYGIDYTFDGYFGKPLTFDGARMGYYPFRSFNGII